MSPASCAHMVHASLYAEQSKPIDRLGAPEPWAVTTPCERCGEPLVTYRYTPAACERVHGPRHRVDLERAGGRCLDCGCHANVMA